MENEWPGKEVDYERLSSVVGIMRDRYNNDVSDPDKRHMGMLNHLANKLTNEYAQLNKKELLHCICSIDLVSKSFAKHAEEEDDEDREEFELELNELNRLRCTLISQRDQLDGSADN